MCGQPREITGYEAEIREHIATKWEAILTQPEVQPLKELLLHDLRTDGGCTSYWHNVNDWIYENVKDAS